MHYKMKPSILIMIKQAFKIRKGTSLPWKKAISAGICAALPPFIGLVLGNLQYGLLAGIGSFTYLYVFNEPYAQRAKKLLFVLLGMTFSVGLGTFFAPSPLLSALMVGVIGSVGTFIFGALRIPGPAAIFFVLGFAMATGMPLDPALAPLRSGLVLLGGILSWIIGMAGWFLKPHGPEIDAVKKVYLELASLLDSVGTENFNEAKQKTAIVMKAADHTLMAGYTSWRTSSLYKRLYLLNHHANSIFLCILKCPKDSSKLPLELSESVHSVATSIVTKNKISEMNIRKPEYNDDAINNLSAKINDAYRILNEPNFIINRKINISWPSLHNIFRGAFDKNSIVFLNSIRYGSILTIAALIAYSFDLNRSYWITLSCAAVMLGSTVMSTFHRAIQRTIGTIIGIVIASMLLSVNPEGFVIAIMIMLMTFLTELFIVRNYAIAVMFITPNALLIAESSTQMHDVRYFAAARITDIIIGCVIGLTGIILVGKRSASSRLPHIMAKTIRSQMQFLLILLSEQSCSIKYKESIKQKVQTNLTNLKIVYTTALGEIPNNKSVLDSLEPAISSIEHLGFLLEFCSNSDKYPSLSDEALAQYMLIFENMANAAEQMQPPAKKSVPEIIEFPNVQKEILNLQDALQFLNRMI